MIHPSITKLVELVENFDDDEAEELFESIAREVRGDRGRTVATMRAIAERTMALYQEEWAVKALWIAYEVAIESGDRELAVTIAIDLAKALDEDLDEDGLAKLHEELPARFEPARELAVRMGIAGALSPYSKRAFIEQNLAAAEKLASSDLERLAIATKLAAYVRSAETAGDGVIERLIARANQLVPDARAREAVIRADLEISRGDPVLAHRHASRAFEMSRAIADEDLREEAAKAFAELLLDADVLERADEVASTLRVQENGDIPAILEDIRRRRGMLAEPPPEAFVAKPITDPEEQRVFGYFSSSALPEGLVEYFTPSDDIVTALRRVIDPQKVYEWSHGPVKTPRDLDSEKIFGPKRSFACGCGRYLGAKYQGIVCERCGVELIDRKYRAFRTAHIQLREPVLHPLHASTVAQLLERGVREVQRANPAELREELHFYKLDDQLARDQYDIERYRPNDPRLPTIRAARESAFHGEYLVLETLPVWPPESERLRDRDAVAQAYMEVLDGPDVRTAVNRLFSTIARQLQ